MYFGDIQFVKCFMTQPISTWNSLKILLFKKNCHTNDAMLMKVQGFLQLKPLTSPNHLFESEEEEGPPDIMLEIGKVVC